jgi:uridine phosphorylase
MGIPNTDFLIREAREVITGPMAMVRFGTCGVVDPAITEGDIIIPRHSILIQQNYDYDPKKDKPEDQFYLSKECPANEKLYKLLVELASKEVGDEAVHKEKTMATAETFYSGQG